MNSQRLHYDLDVHGYIVVHYCEREGDLEIE